MWAVSEFIESQVGRSRGYPQVGTSETERGRGAASLSVEFSPCDLLIYTGASLGIQ